MAEGARFRFAERQLDGVMAEVAQEKAAALRRVWLRLEAALTSLRQIDSGEDVHRTDPVAYRAERDRRVAEAAEALWYYVVQREACGLRDSEDVVRELDVPSDVRLRMGVRTPRS